jgi:tetratricopeptide (TPR) repeat protein
MLQETMSRRDALLRQRYGATSPQLPQLNAQINQLGQQLTVLNQQKQKNEMQLVYLQRELQGTMAKAAGTIKKRDQFLAEWLPYYDPLGRFSDESRRMVVELCTQWIGQDVEFAEAYLMRGFARAYLGEAAGARQDFDRVVQQAASSQLTDNGRQMVEMAMLGCSMVSMEMGQEDQAKAEIARVLQTSPKLALAYIVRGRLNAKNGKRRSALEDYAKAVKLEPDEPVAFREAAWLLASSAAGNDAARAVQLGERACELTQWRDWRCLETYGLAKGADGSFSEAIEWTMKAMKLAPDQPRAELQRRLKLFRSDVAPSNPQPL